MHTFEMEAMQKAIEIQKGRILAKAIIRRANGQYEAVVMFAGSVPNNFFFTFKLRSARSPRKTWKSTGSFPRVQAKTFDGWLAAHAVTSTIISVKVYHSRKLKELMAKPDLAFYGPRQTLELWQTKNLRAKEATKLRGAYPHGGGWPR